jgi:hypothetical protein
MGWIREEAVQLARTITRRRKRRSGWCHPLKLNRNTRRFEKSRRSASASARHALEVIQTREGQAELQFARQEYSGRRRRRIDTGPERRPRTRIEPRRAW